MNMPFQTFEELGDASNCAPRLAALRAELANRGVLGFLVPRADEHQGEYVPERAERLAWLTGFTGSAGLSIVLMEKAALCGRSVGVAVRCNMMTDQNDFAILRYMSLQGLQAQSGGAADFSQAEMAFDVAALEMMNSVGACQGNASALATLEQKIEATIAQCTKPQP